MIETLTLALLFSLSGRKHGKHYPFLLFVYILLLVPGIGTLTPFAIKIMIIQLQCNSIGLCHSAHWRNWGLPPKDERGSNPNFLFYRELQVLAARLLEFEAAEIPADQGAELTSQGVLWQNWCKMYFMGLACKERLQPRCWLLFSRSGKILECIHRAAWDLALMKMLSAGGMYRCRWWLND